MLPLVLASASPRRAAVLAQLGLDFAVHPADMDETRRADEAPTAYVERLARAKAEVVAGRQPRAVVIGGDTAVATAGRILLKPADGPSAVSMLMRLSGGRHEVLTGVAVAWDGVTVSGVARAVVHLRTLDRSMVEAYVATGEPLDKAGAYGIQERGAALVAGIEGDYYTVVGQPVALLLELFGRLDLRYDFTGAVLPA